MRYPLQHNNALRGRDVRLWRVRVAFPLKSPGHTRPHARRPSSRALHSRPHSLQRQLRSQVEIKDTTTSSRTGKTTSGRADAPRTKPPPRRVLPSSGGNTWAGQEGERIRRGERVLLDLWSNEDFLKTGAMASIVALFLLALVVGPPPAPPPAWEPPAELVKRPSWEAPPEPLNPAARRAL